MWQYSMRFATRWIFLALTLAGCAHHVETHGIGGGAFVPTEPIRRISLESYLGYDPLWHAACDTCFIDALREAGFHVELFRPLRGPDGVDQMRTAARAASPDAILTVWPSGHMGFGTRRGYGSWADVHLTLRGPENRATIWRATAMVAFEDRHSILDRDRVCDVARSAVAQMQRDVAAMRRLLPPPN